MACSSVRVIAIVYYTAMDMLRETEVAVVWLRARPWGGCWEIVGSRSWTQRDWETVEYRTWLGWKKKREWVDDIRQIHFNCYFEKVETITPLLVTSRSFVIDVSGHISTHSVDGMWPRASLKVLYMFLRDQICSRQYFCNSSAENSIQF